LSLRRRAGFSRAPPDVAAFHHQDTIFSRKAQQKTSPCGPDFTKIFAVSAFKGRNSRLRPLSERAAQAAHLI